MFAGLTSLCAAKCQMLNTPGVGKVLQKVFRNKGKHTIKD